MSMEELAEQVGQLPPPPEEIPIPQDAPKPKRTRKSRKLTWNERQYGAGFINGMWCGIALGFPLAAGVAALCKVFVGWLMVW